MDLKLTRRADGAIMLGDETLRDWYLRTGVRPTRLNYRTVRGGVCLRCLLTTLVEGEGMDVNALLNAVTVPYRRSDVRLGEALGIPRATAADLEEGWSGAPADREFRAHRGRDNTHWDLGYDAWRQVKDLSPDPA